METELLQENHFAKKGHGNVKLVVTLFFMIAVAAPWGLAQVTAGPDDGGASKPGPATGGKNSCIECHTQMGDELAAPVAALQQGDVHAQRGLSCADCHGGDPTKNEPELAMSRAKGFVARPKPADVPRFCGKCHSNAEFMRAFNPAQRVDQEAEYFTSVHGKLVKQGDTKPATCVSCHGYHGVRAVKDPSAPVYPLNVAQTCGRCHADPDYMKPYGIATDQLQKYSKSVHAEALLKKQDLSAPTCNDCHGNHAAAPPGVTAIANVCGTCHTRQSDLFQKSPHKEPFEAAQMGSCTVCHSNHEIAAPTDDLLGVGEKSACVSCHSQGDAGFVAAEKMRGSIDELSGHIDQAKQRLEKAAYAGMEVSKPLFDLNEAKDRLVNARVVIHRFSPDELEAALKPGLETAIQAHQKGDNALADLQLRRKGLAASLVVIGLAVVGVYLKIRQIERRS